MSWRGDERRQHPRAGGGFWLELRGPETSNRVEVKDISESGVCCLADRPLPEMSRVILEILLPAHRSTARGTDGTTPVVRCQGAVVRCEPTVASERAGYEIAIYFTRLPERDRGEIRHYVAHRLRAN